MTMLRGAPRFSLVCLLGALGCSGSTPEPSPDAGPDGGGDDAALSVAAPAAPEAVEPTDAPAMGPCRPGWRQVESEDGVACEPWPAGGPATCASDEAHFPGEPGCSRIGTDCPASGWPEGLPKGAPTLFVSPAGSADPDGSKGRPYGTIAEATDAATDGTIVAISVGVYDEIVRLSSGVTLWGACVRETVIASSNDSDSAGTVTVAGDGAALRNVQLGGRRAALWVRPRQSVDLRDVLIADAETTAFSVEGEATATGQGVVIRDTRSRETDGLYGYGLYAVGAAQVTLARAVVSGNHGIGVAAVEPGTVVTLTDVRIADTFGQTADGGRGEGLVVTAGAALTAVGLVVEGNRWKGIEVSEEGSHLVLEDSVVRDTVEESGSGLGGLAINVDSGARAECRRVLVERARTIGVALYDGSTLALEDVIVRDTESVDGFLGAGLTADLGCLVEATRLLVARNRLAGVHAFGDAAMDLHHVTIRGTRRQGRDVDGLDGAGLAVADESTVTVDHALIEGNLQAGIAVLQGTPTLTASHIQVLGTLGDPTDTGGPSGRGLEVANGATATVDHALFSGNHGIGVVVVGSDAELLVSDVVIRDTEGYAADGVGGYGLALEEGARAEVTRALFTNNRAVAIGVLEAAGTSLQLTDVTVEDTLTETSTGEIGRALEVQPGATVVVTRALFSGSHEHGVVAFGPDAVLEMTDVDLTGTLRNDHGLGGIALSSVDGAAVTVQTFRIWDSALVAIQVAREGTIDLHHGEVWDNPIAVNVQSEGFDLVRLQDDVLYHDNDTLLDESGVRIPDTTPPRF